MHKRKRARRMSPWTRRAGIIGVMVGAIAVGFGAIAAWHTEAPISGGVQTDDFTAEITLSGGAPPEWHDMDGTITETTHGLRLDVDEAFPGGYVEFRGLVNANQPGRVTGIQLPGVPSGWTAELVEGCSSPAMNDSVTVRVTMTEEAEPGESGDFAEGAGVMVTPQDIAPQNITCEVYEGGA